MNKLKYILIFILLFQINIYADDEVSLIASVNKDSVNMDGQIVYTLKVNGAKQIDTDRLFMPIFEGVTAYSSGSSKSISIINGNMSVSNVYRYILTPETPGRYEIEPASLRYKGNIYKSNPLSIEIIKGVSSLTRKTLRQQLRQEQGYESDQADTYANELKTYFVTMETDKKECFVNEQVRLTFKFYRADKIYSNASYKEPELTGFWKEDLPPQKRYVEVLNGRKYVVTEINKAIFPVKSGELNIEPAVLSAEIPDMASSRRSGFSDDFFDRLFGFDSFGRGRKVDLKTESLKILVKSLPDTIDVSNNFTGAVGKYSINAFCDKDIIKQGDAVNLKIELRGEGNVNSIKSPELPQTDDFNFFVSDKGSVDITKEDNKVKGLNIYEIAVIPQNSGDVVIPALEFTYFDPESKSYETIKTDPIEIFVKESKEFKAKQKQDIVIDYSNQEQESDNKEKVKVFKHDIRHILLDIGTIYRKIYDKNLYFILLLITGLLPILILIQILINMKKYKNISNNLVYKKKNAYKNAKNNLSLAGKSINKKSKEDFYHMMSDLFIKYFSDKLGLPIHSINSVSMQEYLKANNVEPQIITQVSDMLNAFDFACYASSEKDINQLKKHFKESGEILKQIDKQI